MQATGFSLAIGNITGGGDTYSCNDQYYRPNTFFASVQYDAFGKPTNGFGWMETYGVSNGADLTDKAFLTDYSFFVPPGTDAENITLGYRAFAASYQGGSEKYLRDPNDEVLGTDRSNGNRDYCQAERKDVTFRLRTEGASC